MVKDQLDNERGNPLPPLHGLLTYYYYYYQQGIFYMDQRKERIAHNTTFVIPVVEHWPERLIAQCPP